ncbi:MAG: winged helix-turn-helix domain-containing protein [Aestuariibacter sp.]
MNEAIAIEQNVVTELHEIMASDLTLNRLTRCVKRGGKTLSLQAREFQLLEYLLLNKNKIVSREMLLLNVWHYNFDPQTNVVDVHISRLRAKVDKPFSIKLIETVRGSGYRLVDRDE